MKRSEMIDIMMDVIYNFQGRMVTDSEVIDNILTAIEKAGMLPPAYNSEYDLTPNDRGPTIAYFWEPEDEK